jgi:alpha/beta superfamily hydrolase
MNVHTQRHMVSGPAGPIECALDRPSGPSLGMALICHPHPLGGGTLDNKVVQTLARAAVELGWRSVRFNFRGVGASGGEWSDGPGEIADALCVLHEQRAAQEPLLLAGFSFGAYVASQVCAQLAASDKPQRLVLVGPSTQKQSMADVPSDTVVIHGESDDVVPLSATLAWAKAQSLPVIVFPGVGHFFHGQLGLLKSVVVRELLPRLPH